MAVFNAAQRIQGITYTNSLNGPMIVMAGFQGTENNDSSNMYATVNGDVVQRIYNHAVSATNDLSYNWFFVVPEGGTYRINCNRGFYYWVEYRV